MNNLKIVFLLAAMVASSISSFAQKSFQEIKPTELWPDDKNEHIQAHGGGIIKRGKVYYWFGEDRRKNNEINTRYVGCYSSKDLVNWKFRGQVFKASTLEGIREGALILERPKVFYNEKTKKYVMYMHLDSTKYSFARVGVAVSDKVDGEYKFVKSFRPLGLESRDIGQFIDDDGTAYLIFESRPSKGFYIAKLTDDYMDVEKKPIFIEAPLEGGAIVHYNGLYYAIGSALTGWRPNPNMYATATSLSGPWSEFKHIAPPETDTYKSQSTMMIKVTGTKGTTVIFMGDQWKPKTQWDSRYLWMPLEIGNGNLWLPKPRPWMLNVKTGEWKYSETNKGDGKYSDAKK